MSVKTTVWLKICRLSTTQKRAERRVRSGQIENDLDFVRFALCSYVWHSCTPQWFCAHR